nr:hydrogenase maturation nickel metallochaperone HypA [Desulfobulbaceae bacterium]
MHEASIIMGVLETVTRQCQQEGYTKINSIRLRIGKASSILPDSLYFAFDAAKINTLAHGAELIIESVPIGGTCKACGHDFAVEEFIFNCQNCQSTKINVSRGFDMEIVDMDVD